MAPDVYQSILQHFGAAETALIVKMAADQDLLEAQQLLRMRRSFAENTSKVLANSYKERRLVTKGVDFTAPVMENTRDAMYNGIVSTIRPKPSASTHALAAIPAPKSVPKSLAELRRWWDHYRKLKVVPPRQQVMAKKIRTAFLKQIQEAWHEASTPFLEGDVYDQKAAVAVIQERADVSFSRAKMITETETTFYYNQVRRQIYDQSPDVAGYLFMAIRDHRTTSWCRSRHGLVYLRDDPLLDLETPPIHWNCRSDVLPLVLQSPEHRRLLEDPRFARRLHACTPLPPEWTGANRLR